MAQPRVDSAAEKRRMAEILRALKRAYPEAECSLSFQTPFQLLVATILSAQCTDERVNLVTPALFKRFGTPQKMAVAKPGEIEELIRSTGFFRSKAKSLLETSRSLVELYDGDVPADLEKLTRLRGVGRKTANVVLGTVYGVPSVVIDTHAGRLARRLGFTKEVDPVKVERAIQSVVDPKDWTAFAHLMIHHGRAICTARKAACEECPVARLCPRVGVG